MRANGFFIVICSLAIAHAAPVFGQRTGEATSQARSTPVDDPVKALVGRLDLERYKATIKGLTQPVLSFYGAGQAAQSGNRDKARYYFSRLIDMAGSSDSRAEMEKARRYLASN